jgi:hypothetical protein
VDAADPVSQFRAARQQLFPGGSQCVVGHCVHGAIVASPRRRMHSPVYL